MSDKYDWAEDAIASYALAIKTLRERYLEERLPGESAEEWLDRFSSKCPVIALYCPVHTPMFLYGPAN